MLNTIEQAFAADGIARGLRPGFMPNKPSPAPEQPRPMTAEEEQRLLAELEETKRRLAAVIEATRAADADAHKPGDEAAQVQTDQGHGSSPGAQRRTE
jgi:hypothetical protein